MKITGIETFTVGAGWKNWLFVQGPHRRRHPRRRRGHAQRLHPHDRGRRPRARASRDRRGSAPHQRAGEAHARQRLARRRPYPSHGDRRDRGRLLGHPRQVARRARPSAARRPRPRQRARLRQWLVPHRADAGGLSRGGRGGARQGLQGVQARSLRHRAGLYRATPSSSSPTTSPRRSATSLPPDIPHPDRRPCPLHRRSRRCGRRAALAPLDIYWWEEPTTRDRQETVHEVAHRSPIPVATGEMYDTVGQFFTLAERRRRQHLPARADVARRHRPTRCRWPISRRRMAATSRPHQSGGPVATAVCLQLAACVPNFLIQEHFDAFNEPWTQRPRHLAPDDRPGERPPVAARRARASASTSCPR